MTRSPFRYPPLRLVHFIQHTELQHQNDFAKISSRGAFIDTVVMVCNWCNIIGMDNCHFDVSFKAFDRTSFHCTTNGWVEVQNFYWFLTLKSPAESRIFPFNRKSNFSHEVATMRHRGSDRTLSASFSNWSTLSEYRKYINSQHLQSLPEHHLHENYWSIRRITPSKNFP